MRLTPCHRQNTCPACGDVEVCGGIHLVRERRHRDALCGPCAGAVGNERDELMRKYGMDRAEAERYAKETLIRRLAPADWGRPR